MTRPCAAGRRLSVLPWLAVLAVLALGPAACSSEKPQQAAERPPAPVSMQTSQGKPMPVEVLAIGQVEALATVSVTPQVQGQITQVHFQEGQIVKAGDPLFTIDPRPYQAALEQAQANLERDQAQLKEYRQEAQRNKVMVARDFVSKQDYDQIVAKVEGQEATVKADQAAVEKARLELQYCHITAPINGSTGSLLVNKGNVVASGGSQALVVIKQSQPCYVSFAVPEVQLPAIKEYRAKGKLKVEAALPAPANLKEDGELSFVDNQVDKDTGTILLKGTFANPALNLWPGQFVNTTLTLTVIPQAVVVASRAIQTGPEGPFVFVVKDDSTVEARPIKPGVSAGDETQIAEGLQAGEKVVTDGQLALYPGAKVVERPLAAPQAAAKPAGKAGR